MQSMSRHLGAPKGTKGLESPSRVIWSHSLAAPSSSRTRVNVLPLGLGGDSSHFSSAIHGAAVGQSQARLKAVVLISTIKSCRGTLTIPGQAKDVTLTLAPDGYEGFLQHLSLRPLSPTKRLACKAAGRRGDPGSPHTSEINS